MEAMEAESEGKFTCRQIYEYIKDGKHRGIWEMRQRSQFFKVQEMHLYYTGGMFLCQC